MPYEFKLLLAFGSSLIAILNGYSQNLVPNPSFENVKELRCDLNAPLLPPYTDPKVWFESILYDWYLPTNLPAQVYSTLLDPNCQANPTRFENGYPRDGYNMVEIELAILISQPSSNGRTYIQTKLSEPLREGRSYLVGGYQMLANNFGLFAANNLGMLFTQSRVETDNTLMLQFRPQFNDPEINKDRYIWKPFGGCVKSEGNEQYLTIGGFYPDAGTKVHQVVPSVDIRGEDFASYFIDSVYVEAVKEPSIPNVITPNQDCCNERFVLQGAIANQWSVTIFNRWGQQVYWNGAYNNEWNGGDLNDDVYFYHVQHRICEDLFYKGSITISR